MELSIEKWRRAIVCSYVTHGIQSLLYIYTYILIPDMVETALNLWHFSDADLAFGN